MKKLISILSLSFALAAFSCTSGDDDNTTDPVEETPILLTRLSSSTDDPATIKYNGSKISEVAWIDGKNVYEYTGDLITKNTDYNETGAKIGNTDFTYSNDKLIKVVYASGTSSETTTYSYPNANTINEIITRTTTYMGSTSVYKDVTTYTLNNGNIVSQETAYYFNNALAGNISSTYTYDNKNSPSKNVIGFDKIMVYNFSTGDEKTACSNNLLTKNQSNTTVAGNNTKYKNVSAITYSVAGYPTQIITNQYDKNNQIVSTYTDFFEYNK